MAPTSHEGGLTKNNVRRAIQREMNGCLNRPASDEPPATNPSLGDKMAPALAELLVRASRADPSLTRIYLQTYLNTGDLRSEGLPPISGKPSSDALERARAYALLGLGHDPAALAAMEAALHMVRLEVRVRPFLLLMIGLLRVARGQARSLGKPRKAAAELAEATFFKPRTKKSSSSGAPPSKTWQARDMGDSIGSYREEIRTAMRQRVLTRTSISALRAFGVSVGTGGDSDGRSERIPLHRLRNSVSHGDVAFSDAGATAIGFNASWRSKLRSGRRKNFKEVPSQDQAKNMVNFEGLLCIIAGFERGAVWLLLSGELEAGYGNGGEKGQDPNAPPRAAKGTGRAPR